MAAYQGRQMKGKKAPWWAWLLVATYLGVLYYFASGLNYLF